MIFDPTTQHLIPAITGAIGWVLFFFVLALYLGLKEKTRRLAKKIIAEAKELQSLNQYQCFDKSVSEDLVSKTELSREAA
jgi:Mg2+/citrate symporter